MTIRQGLSVARISCLSHSSCSSRGGGGIEHSNVHFADVVGVVALSQGAAVFRHYTFCQKWSCRCRESVWLWARVRSL